MPRGSAAAALLPDTAREDARSRTRAAPLPAGTEQPGWVFLPRRPRSSVLQHRSRAPPSQNPPRTWSQHRRGPPTRQLTAPRDGCRGSSPAPLPRAPLAFYCIFFFLPFFLFFLLFFFLSTWHTSISTPLTRSGFQPGEHRNGLIISDEESVCSIRQRRVIIYL